MTGEWSKQLNLFRVMSRAHLRSSDYRSVLGALWSLMGPLLNFGVLYFIFVDRFGKGIPLFPLKLLVGVVLLHFFYSMIQVTMQAIRSSHNVVVNSLASTEILILAALTVPLVKFTVEVGLCAGIAAALGAFSWQQLPLLAGLMALFFLLSAGIGLVIALLACLAHDVEEIWSAVSNLLVFLSPIFYSLNMLSPKGRLLTAVFNPLTPFVLGFQSVVTGEAVPYFSRWTLIQAAVYAVLAAAAGWILLKRMEKQVFENL